MKLYGSYTSPFVRHCRIALLESGLDFELIETDNKASAQQSPTQKVPFLQDGDTVLTDSTAIIKYIREKSGQPYLADITEYDAFCLVNTSMDACVNLFFLERDGINVEQSSYLQRQRTRVDSTLAELDQMPLPKHSPYGDMALRLACYLAWGLYRGRISLAAYPNLAVFLEHANQYPAFAQTAPPPL
ncbi:glutathione S-transferase family protein [Gilvimarinus polysaccharolyticus]|uniref:glutathione S-transferase family protein n=1 Tax=Gilvimarinus polysaccharolyticus TaxID=863921 RepID=UPI000673323B|nr:glutathione S-transferase family protein [Gilvimarinus polysaccharolyticus]